MSLTRAAVCRTIGAALLTLGAAPPLRAGAAVVSGGPGVLELVAARSNLSSFAAAIKAAGLEAELAGAGPFTIFAPLNDGFAKLSDAERAAFNGADGRDRLLSYIVRDEVVIDMGNNMELDGEIRTAAGTKLALHGVDGKITINGVRAVAYDIRGKNGVLTTLAGFFPA